MDQIFVFLDNFSLCLVLIVVVIIWLGIAIYVSKIGRGVKKLEEEE